MRHVGVNRAAVVFDRYPLFLEAVESLLRGFGVDVVGTAVVPEDAVALIECERPDVFVAGLSSRGSSMDPLELVRSAVAAHPTVKVIALGDEGDDQNVEAMFAAGVSAYLRRSALPDDVALAIRQSYEPSIHLRRRAATSRPDDGAPLTARECDILRLLALGHSNSDLARMLHITPRTVRYHLSNIYRKLDVANRTQAVRRAQQLNLLPAASARAI